MGHNVFGVLSVYQAMLPLRRATAGGRIVNVSSGVGSLTRNADPDFAYRGIFGPVYSASKTALNAITLAMAIEFEPEGVRVSAVSPSFTSTNLNGYAGTESVEQDAREAVRVALLGPDAPTARSPAPNRTLGRTGIKVTPNCLGAIDRPLFQWTPLPSPIGHRGVPALLWSGMPPRYTPKCRDSADR